jgi:hypothetical protein
MAQRTVWRRGGGPLCREDRRSERAEAHVFHHAHVTWCSCPKSWEALPEAWGFAVVTLGLYTAALLECQVV